MAKQIDSKSQKVIKRVLLALLIVFSLASISFSFFVLFTDIGSRGQVSHAQARGMFTAFIHDYIDEVHPQRLPLGRSWRVQSIDFTSNNLAVVEATDGQTKSLLEFIYVIERPNVRVMKINDMTGRDMQDAKISLIRYLDFLQREDYDNASALYGGPIARLVPYGAPSAPLPQLLEGYCEQVSPAGKCLVFSIGDTRKDPVTGTYRFTVMYQNPDSTKLYLASGKEAFELQVEARDRNTFVVTSLPFD